MKVILPVKQIPDGGIVTKINGTKTYEVRNTIRIFGDTPDRAQTIVADANTRFLIASDSSPSICAIDGATELVWDAPEELLYQMLGELTNNRL